MNSISHELYEVAKQYIPGGVNSPVRAFNGVGGEPPFFKRGQGAYLIDEDDHRYVDYVLSWGPLVLGHCHPQVIEAVSHAIHRGLSFGAPTASEINLAKKICELMPNIEQVRMINSGTEATMTAIRLARGFTGRNKFIKFVGCYHGHSDALLVQAGSGALTLGVPSSPGVPAATTQDTLLANFNDLDSVSALFEAHGDDIACIILEPVPGNMNCVIPNTEFLTGLRQLCDQHGSLLIFDEVMTGFRVALGGAQALFNIKPDLTTLGKVIGGGMPVGAVGGRKDVMQHLAPAGPVYQAGTLSGNPIAMTAGLVTLDLISQPGAFEQLTAQTEKLVAGLAEIAGSANIPLCAQHVGSMFGLIFTDAPRVDSYEQVMQSNVEHFKQFYHGMLKQGVYFGPSAYEAAFMSLAHDDEAINKTLTAADRILSRIAN